MRHHLPANDMQILRKRVFPGISFPLLLCHHRRRIPAGHQRSGKQIGAAHHLWTGNHGTAAPRQNHFVILYKVKNKKKFYIADPGKGLITYTEKEFKNHWISTQSKGEEKGIAMFIQPTPAFYELSGETMNRKRSFKFLFGYIKQYRRYFGQIILGALTGCLLQLIFPFLTQAIVDIGITHQNLGIIYLILLGQLILTISRTSVDFIRRWILLHISMRINISLVSDFFIKLLKLPMSFFDTKLMGDLMQRMNDHNRVEKFLTTQMLNVTFSLLSFMVFGCVLLGYNTFIFLIFLTGSILYGIWIAIFLKKRKLLDYELFEKQAMNNNKTYQFITSMQEIKLQNCGAVGNGKMYRQICSRST